jgi:hypothetical protein
MRRTFLGLSLLLSFDFALANKIDIDLSQEKVPFEKVMSYFIQRNGAASSDPVHLHIFTSGKVSEKNKMSPSVPLSSEKSKESKKEVSLNPLPSVPSPENHPQVNHSKSPSLLRTRIESFLAQWPDVYEQAQKLKFSLELSGESLYLFTNSIIEQEQKLPGFTSIALNIDIQPSEIDITQDHISEFVTKISNKDLFPDLGNIDFKITNLTEYLEESPADKQKSFLQKMTYFQEQFSEKKIAFSCPGIFDSLDLKNEWPHLNTVKRSSQNQAPLSGTTKLFSGIPSSKLFGSSSPQQLDLRLSEDWTHKFRGLRNNSLFRNDNPESEDFFKDHHDNQGTNMFGTVGNSTRYRGTLLFGSPNRPVTHPPLARNAAVIHETTDENNNPIITSIFSSFRVKAPLGDEIQGPALPHSKSSSEKESVKAPKSPSSASDNSQNTEGSPL